mgnify:CR=1 FL=1
MKKFAVVLTALICSTVAVFAQVKGKVTDARDASPVAGASVNIQGTQRGTMTASDGTFSIDLSRNATIVVSSVGFLPQSKAASPGEEVNFVLQADSRNLNEVVVTALNIKREKKHFI